MGDWLADKVIARVLNWFAEMVVGAVDQLWDLLGATAFQNPDVSTFPQVTTFAGRSLAIVNVVYVLAFLYVGVMILGRDTFQSRYGFGELVPRLVIGLIGANFALPVCSAVITLANATIAALTGQPITSPESTGQIRTIVLSTLYGQNAGTADGFLLVLVGLLIAVLAGMLLIQWLFRIGLLVVLVGVSPLALALHGTPHTEGAAKLWWRALLGSLGTVVLQAVALHITLTIFLSPDANLPALGLPADPAPVFNLFVVMCLLVAVVKIPGLMRRYVTQSKPGISGQLFRILVVQNITRSLRRVFSGGRGGGTGRSGRGGGGPGGPVPGGGSGPRWPTTSGGGRPAPGPLPPASASGSGPRPAPVSGWASSRPAAARPDGAGFADPTGRLERPASARSWPRESSYTRTLKRRAAAPTRSGRTAS